MFKKFFRKEPEPILPSFAPEGECAYVIGDVHGCLDPLERLLSTIEHRAATVHPALKTHLVFVGDLIDRGPYSAQVVEHLRCLSSPQMKLTFLMGNHEEVFLDVLKGNVEGMIRWFDWGGRDTARSYGVDNLGLLPISPEQVLFQLQKRVPKSHLEFISNFQPYAEFGDYVFVHAGLRPKTPLSEQKNRDMRWIRDGFLDYEGAFPKKVVHGHTIVKDPENRPNRIAVDTGVYMKDGALTAAFLYQDQVEFFSEAA
ncbi:MAG: metallophosphoesterase family protein [Pseudomonadota bacterium]